MTNGLSEEIKAMVAEIGEIPVENLDPAKSFVDLDIDSMKAIEIVAAVEKKYGVVVPEAEIPKIGNLTQVIELVKKLKGEA